MLITVVRATSQDYRSTQTRRFSDGLRTLRMRCGTTHLLYPPDYRLNSVMNVRSLDTEPGVSELVLALAGTSLVALNHALMALITRPYPELELSVSGA